MSSSDSTFGYYIDYKRLNLETLQNVYKEEKETDINPLHYTLCRMETIPTLLFHEKAGIIPMFREKRPKTRKIIDDWIDNTSNLSHEDIKKDLDKLKDFLLSCNDIFNNEEDIVHLVKAMTFFLSERILWRRGSDTTKLKTILGI
jgi:hypothetical protein